jgi:spore photoproduct lyase
MKTRWNNLLIDREAQGDPLAARLRERLPEAKIEIVEDARGYLSSGFRASGTLVLMRRRGAFVKNFPQTPGTPPCGEKYVITMMNCPYSCSYCYLRSYLEHRSVVIFTDTERMKDEISRAVTEDSPRIITTGEMSDSLALDDLTGTTLDLLPLFEGSATLLEARTKSDNVKHLLSAAADTGRLSGGSESAASLFDRLLVTFTLGPEKMIEREEPGTASLEARLDAIKLLTGAGIKTGVRFDPIIPAYADIDSYRRLLDGLEAAAGGKGIYRCELGVLRFPPGLLESVRESAPHSPILRGEYLRDGEGKLRLYRPSRVSLYSEIAGLVLRRFPGTGIELCMESGAARRP